MQATDYQKPDPFAAALRHIFKHHFLHCAAAYVIVAAARAITLASVPDGAVTIATTWISSLFDFLVTVLFLTLLRAMYAVPFLFVRKSLSRLGNYVLFTLVFSVIFTNQMNDCLGVSAEAERVRFFYPWPKRARVEPLGSVGKPNVRETGLVTILGLPEAGMKFVPAYNVDRKAREALERIRDVL